MNPNVTANLVEGGKIIFYDKKGKEISSFRPIFQNKINPKRLVQQYQPNGEVVYLDLNGEEIEIAGVGQASGNAVLMAQNGSLVYTLR